MKEANGSNNNFDIGYYPQGIFKLLCAIFNEPYSPEECAEWLKKYTKEKSSILWTVLKTLTPREEKILLLRFGLIDGKERTFKSIGDEFSLSGERIRQIQAKALRKLKHPSCMRRLIRLWK